MEVLLVARVVLDIVEVLAVMEVVEEEDAILLLLDAVQLPGMHCEYQSLEYVQQDPEAHIVGPAQPIPPPVVVIRLRSWDDRVSYIGPKPTAGQKYQGSGQARTQWPSLH